MRELAIRPMSRENLAELIAIEKDVEGPTWSEDNFLSETKNAYYQDNHEDGIIMELEFDREPT